MEGSVKEQMEWTQEIQKEFNNMVEENKHRIQLMERSYDEVKAMFENRPSREDDIQLIQKLQQLCAIKESELKRAIEEGKFFKL